LFISGMISFSKFLIAKLSLSGQVKK